MVQVIAVTSEGKCESDASKKKTPKDECKLTANFKFDVLYLQRSRVTQLVDLEARGCEDMMDDCLRFESAKAPVY